MSPPPQGWRGNGPPERAVTPDTLAGDINDLGDMISALSERVDKLAAGTLTAEDVSALRLLLEQDRRVRWMWASARTGALWVSAVVLGFTVGVDALRTVIKRLVS
jgi:hypothetical protein